MSQLRWWQVVLFPLGAATLVVILGFTLWLIYAVGSAWAGRLF